MTTETDACKSNYKPRGSLCECGAAVALRSPALEGYAMAVRSLLGYLVVRLSARRSRLGLGSATGGHGGQWNESDGGGLVSWIGFVRGSAEGLGSRTK